MRFSAWGLMAGAFLLSPLVWGVEETPSVAFWEWYLEYADADGQVFDPLALEELGALDPNPQGQQSTDAGQQRATQADGERETKAAQENKSEITTP